MRPHDDDNQELGRSARNGLPRWYGTLAFRLAVLVNITATGVLALFWCIDYARERSVHVREAVERLAEEAKVLRVTRSTLADTARFQTYLDDFCHQMDLHSSPGHHIIIADSTGNIVARAHVHDEPSLEDVMRAAVVKGSERFHYRADEFVVSALYDADGTSIVIAQSLAPAYAIIHAQALSRAISLAVLSAAICLLATAVIWRWVRRPIRILVDCTRSIERRRLGTRVKPSGPPEMRFLAAGLNEMIDSLDRHERDRIQELQRARQIQERLLPGANTKIPNTQIAFQYEPAEPIGGDYLDIFQSEHGRWLIAIADVCGHGVGAALLATLFKTHVRNHAATCPSPSDILQAINRELSSVMSDGDFVTCLIVLYDVRSGELVYANAGHPAGLVVEPQGQVVAHLKATSSVLGVWPEAKIESGNALLRAGDRLVLYTDGLVECLDTSERVFGNERLAHSVALTTALAPTEQVVQILREARKFAASGRMMDDVTVLVLQRNADS